MKINSKFFNVTGWISLSLFVYTFVWYWFLDGTANEPPMWFLCVIASWYYRDHLKEKENIE